MDRSQGLFGALIALLGVARQELGDDLIERRLGDFSGGLGRLALHLLESALDAFTGESGGRGHHLVAQYPDGVEVSQRRDNALAKQLGRHIARGADALSGHGEGAGAAGIEDFDEAKIEQLDRGRRLRRQEEDIGGLEVTVDDLSLVGFGERREDLRHQEGRLYGPARTLIEAPREGFTVEPLHNDEEDSSLGVAAGEGSDDIGVAKLKGHLGLLHEALRCRLIVAGGLAAECFDGDRVALFVAPFIDLGEATAADHRADDDATR